MGSAHGGAAVAGEAQLRAAIESLADADLHALSDEASLQALRRLWPLVCAVQAQMARRIGRVHQRDAAKQDGFVSARAFLRGRLFVNPATASALVKAGAGLTALSDTQAALAAGEISVEHAAVLADALKELGAAVMAGGVEKVLLEYARSLAPPAGGRASTAVPVRNRAGWTIRCRGGRTRTGWRCWDTAANRSAPRPPAA